MEIPIVRPQLGEAEARAVAEVVRSGWVAQGPEVAAFERELGDAVSAPHAVAVSSCTAALELCLHALGVGFGDDVVTVSHSFIATANAVVAVGARPVFVDIDPVTYGMDARLVEAALTEKTRAILCVHQLGFPCDLPALLDIAGRRGIPVVEDAACAIGSEIEMAGKWQRIGRPHGVAACFSFHPRKVITTGDGGMITTKDEALAERLRLLRQHAMTVASTLRHGSQRVTFESFVEPAYNFRMTDVQAAMARPQLARLDQSIATRRKLALRYREALEGHPVLAPPHEPSWMRGNFQSYPLRIRPEARSSQVKIMQHLLECGVASRRGVGNAHMEPAYAHLGWTCGPEPCDEELHRKGRCLRLPHSEAARDDTVMIPLFHGMTQAEQDHVLAALGSLRP
ncbi:MAG: DegT/DnrJ/EryC1/StrS family aminotransferase [Deltaproteobacteria bacterium]|nr:DegT/DnrJ/EryC1/StrS family aminotransferase [Deltaproteobacteria bacterium]